MFDERAFIQQRLDAANARLVQIDAAIATVLAGGQSYSQDSGQTRIMVTRTSLSQLRAAQTHTTNEIVDLNRQLCSGGPTVLAPGF